MDVVKKNKSLCLISGEQLEMIEGALREGKRLELFSETSGNVKIKVVTRKDLMYNKQN